MKRTVYTLLICIGLVMIAGISVFVGYNAMNISKNKPIAMPLESSINKALDNSPDIEEQEIIQEAATEEEEQIRVNADTKLIFEYYYQEDGTTQTQIEQPSSFMIDKTQDDFAAVFYQWEIKEFTSEQVVLRREIEEKARQSYKISVMDGYLAVYYTDSLDGSKLKEITDTPISALPEEEQIRLIEGIEVTGEDALMRILQDLSS